ncbi:MAG: UbiA prenyltransferase family protein [Planctomycetota bacterium]|jgi:4-hydroxybenzoate polyprenyltransferase
MIRQLVRLMRPGDWVKNVFVLPALVFSQALTGDDDAARMEAIGRTAVAFAAFCLLASGLYAINDVLDVEADRTHPVKRKRPVASGEVAPQTATALGLVLVAVGLAAGFMVNVKLGLVLALYLALQVAYNLKLKRVLVVDVVAIAIGFGFRASGGAVAINVPISVWLLLCVFFLCLYLAFIKRLCDITSAKDDGRSRWRSPAGYDDRTELNWLLGVSAVMAVVTYLVYALSEHARTIFGDRMLGFAIMTPLVLIAVHRFYRRARLGVSDSPLAALRDDLAVLATVVLFVVGTLATLYVPQVEQILQALFSDTGGAMSP